MKLRLSTLLITFSACLLTFSCGKPGKKDNPDFGKSEDAIKDEIQQMTKGIPKPSEIPYLLQSTGAEFNPGLPNDRAKADSYSSQSDKAAVNLGVYATDIGYLSSYEKSQAAIDYLTTCKRLADDLGLSATFDPSILKRFEANISNKDSLGRILDGTMGQIDQYLVGDNRSKLAALLATGSFIESLYLCTAIIKTYPPELDAVKNAVLMPLIKLVADQRKSVSEVSKMLSVLDQSGIVPGIAADLKTLEASYAALNLDEQIKNNKGTLLLTDKNLVEITKIVEKLRGQIVE